MATLKIPGTKLSLKASQVFMLSALVVNAGNYIYNLVLGRLLGPKAFADAAILITFLLILSFIAMTLQLSVAKFTGSFEAARKDAFIRYSQKWSFWIGSAAGIIVFCLATYLQEWLNTDSSGMFRIFGMGIPIYFVMSVNRGYFQGEREFIKLSITYQAEMFTRLILSLLLILLLPFRTSELVAIGILVSLIPGLLPFKKVGSRLLPAITASELSHLKKFVVVTAFYELTQILINNGDILLVKHFFDTHSAGLYASMALIGRGVYFVAWMFVMMLLPKVVHLVKQNKNTTALFFKYLGMIGGLTASVVMINLFFPEMIINLLFGEAYAGISNLLWKYALASALFAMANVFVYYFLSLDNYLPVILSGCFGGGQMLLIYFKHNSLEEVVGNQIIAMTGLLLVQIAFFIYQLYKTGHRTQFSIYRKLKINV